MSTTTQTCRAFELSERTHDPRWDTFLANSPSGHHVQLSLWGNVKAAAGWETRRILVTEDQQIVGGAQMLIRRARLVGKIGYVPKGPVVAGDDRELQREIIGRLCAMARANRVRLLLVQPPSDGEALAERLPEWGFRIWPTELAPSATVQIDLADDPEELLARMSKGMRHGIRRSQRNGISVREGSRDDLPTFHRLLQATGQRRGFTPFGRDYFERMWDELHPAGYLRLFISQVGDEAVSAQIVVAFGDSIIAKQIGWSGQHARLRPNEALDWATIQWGQAHGYRYYDLEGIEPDAAQAVLRGQGLPEAYVQSPTAYKLRMGGSICLRPPTYCYILNPAWRHVYGLVGERLLAWPTIRHAVYRFRTN